MRPVVTACLFCLCVLTPAKAQQTSRSAQLGVLAYLGYEDALARWHGVKIYLDAAIPDWTFEIVPVTLASASNQIEAGQIDFLLTNPGHFAALSTHHPMSVLASREALGPNGAHTTEFGSLVFARKDAGISLLSDAEGKRVAAIDEMAFGGFQLAWREFQRAGVNLFTDTSELDFVGFPMDQVAEHVASGRADIGIVRTGLMERLILENRYAEDDFVFLNTSAAVGYPYQVSTRLYPEWPFAAMASVEPALRNAVALALLSARTSPLAEGVRMTDRWAAPVSYATVTALNSEFAARIKSRPFWQRNLPFVAGMVLLIAAWALVFLLRGQRSATPPPKSMAFLPELTPREREILDHIAQGLSSKEIARALDISPKTVEYHRANLLKKYGARSSTQLVALAT